MDKNRYAFKILATTLAVGLIGDLLLQGASWGANIALWGIVLAAAGVALAAKSPLTLSRSAKGFGVCALIFVLFFAWRDSDELKAANATAVFFCLGGMLMTSREGGAVQSGIGKLLGGILWQWLMLCEGLLRLIGSAHYGTLSTDNKGRAAAIARGIALATPLILVFGALFAAADDVYRAGLDRMARFDVDFGSVFLHAVTFALATCFAGGVYNRLFLGLKGTTPPPVQSDSSYRPYMPPPPKPLRLGVIEVGIALSSMVGLFASFAAVQFRYLFGSHDLVQQKNGLTYSSYAHSGFFELVAVAALTLVVLLSADALLKREKDSDEVVFRILGFALGGLVFVVMASAMQRMKIYTEAYGLSTERLYVSAFMAWLALAFGWMFATTLNRRPRYFAFGSLMAGLWVIFGLNAIAPDAVIARVNLARPKVDFAYLKLLSDDSVPAMVAAREGVSPEIRKEIDELAQERRDEASKSDWRESNLSRLQLSSGVR